MLDNSNDDKEITHLCLIAKEGVGNRDTSNSDDDDDACTSNNEEEEEKIEYDSPD